MITIYNKIKDLSSEQQMVVNAILKGRINQVNDLIKNQSNDIQSYNAQSLCSLNVEITIANFLISKALIKANQCFVNNLFELMLEVGEVKQYDEQ